MPSDLVSLVFQLTALLPRSLWPLSRAVFAATALLSPYSLLRSLHSFPHGLFANFLRWARLCVATAAALMHGHTPPLEHDPYGHKEQITVRSNNAVVDRGKAGHPRHPITALVKHDQ